MIQLGISSFAFGWAVGAGSTVGSRGFGVEDLLWFATAHHVPAVQFGDNLPLHTLSAEALDTLAAHARRRGLRIETGARGLTAGHLHRYIELSRRLDARLLRFVIDAPTCTPTIDEVVAIVREALPELAASRVVLGIENHDRFPSRQLRALVDRLASEHVGICLDTANSLGAGEGIREVLAALAPVCVNLHVKDYAIMRLPHQMGFTVTGRPLGEGQLPLDEVLSAVANGGRCSTAVVETWPPQEANAVETLAQEAVWAIRSLSVLRNALSTLPGNALPGNPSQ